MHLEEESTSYKYDYEALGHPCEGYTSSEMEAGEERWAQALENELPIEHEVTYPALSVTLCGHKIISYRCNYLQISHSCRCGHNVFLHQCNFDESRTNANAVGRL